MKLEETENFKFKYLNNGQTTTSYINNNQKSDNTLAEKKLKS